MLEARKSEYFQKAFSIYNRNLIKRRFEAFWVAGREHLTTRAADIPAVVYANHSSWWDGLVAWQLCRDLRLDAYAMMEEKNLLEYPFHRKLGAFSVVRESPKDAWISVSYAAGLLKADRSRLIWVFPQGEIKPNSQRPIKFFSGVSRIIEKSGTAMAYPIAIRYEFLGSYKPEVFMRIGVPDLANIKGGGDRRDYTVLFRQKLEGLLDQIGFDIASDSFEGYSKLI